MKKWPMKAPKSPRPLYDCFDAVARQYEIVPPSQGVSQSNLAYNIVIATADKNLGLSETAKRGL